MTRTQRTILQWAFAVLILMFLFPPVDYKWGIEAIWLKPQIDWRFEHRNLFFWALLTVLLLVITHPRRTE